jgi:hypothetical protein
MKKARRIVNKLLESDEGIDDPMQYAVSTAKPPGNLVSDTLRDELVDRGWRHIHVREEDEGEWVVEAGVIDPYHRSKWLNAGARVAPMPEESPDLRMKLMRWFKAAAKRAGMNVTEAAIEDVSPAYTDGYDLYSEFNDFEEDSGDWNVAIRFKWTPVNKFWSKASQSLGYETKPYQQAAKPKPEPRKPVKSLLTPEQQDQRDEEHRQMMRKMQARRKKSEEEFEKNVARWKREGGPFPSYLM